MRPIALAAASLLALASPAAAATLTVATGPSGAVPNCTGDPAGSFSSDHFITVDRVCSRDDIGFAHGRASAGVGHLGVKADAATINGDGLFAGMGADATYQDVVVFTHDGTGADADSTFADVSLNLFLDGLLNAASPDSGFAAATIEGYATVGGGFFSFRRILRGDGAEEGFNDFFTDGVLGDPAGARLTTPTVRVNFDTPIALSLHLQAGVFSRGVFSSALSDFGGSFKFASGDVFNLPDGVTVNAGDYLVNNRFIDPLAPPSGAVPEPAAWALMITGFGLAGATLRRRHLLV